MRILVSRWQMCGGGLAYRVAVPVSSAPIAENKCGHFLNLEIDGKRSNFVNLVDATLPAHHFELSTGLARWEEYKHYERIARVNEFVLAEAVFPELTKARAAGDSVLSALWYTGLITPEPTGHKDIWIDVDIAANPTKELAEAQHA